MPVYRGPDGKIIEEKTDKGEDVNRSTDRERRPMPPASAGGGQAPGSGRLDAPTQKMDVSESRSQSPLPSDEKTRIIGGRAGRQASGRCQNAQRWMWGVLSPLCLLMKKLRS